MQCLSRTQGYSKCDRYEQGTTGDPCSSGEIDEIWAVTGRAKTALDV